MPTDAFEMALVHQAFRNELHNAAGLIRDVNGRDTNRAAIVGGHVDFIATALHHHHAAEDEVIWPKLRERAATREVDITRMEDTHRDIADDIARVRKIASSWADSADPRLAQQLVGVVEQLSARVDEHLEDEERSIVRSSTPNSHPTNGSDFWPAAGGSCSYTRSLDSCWPASSSTLRRPRSGGASWPTCRYRNVRRFGCSECALSPVTGPSSTVPAV